MRSVLKKSSVIGLLAIGLLVSGCTFFEKQAVIPEVSQEEKQLDKRTGTVQIQLDAQTRVVQHVLQSENGETVKLASLSVELDRYVGRKVQVEGMYEERENMLQVELITTLSEELGVKKSYINGALGASFSYPANWSIDETNVAQKATLRIYPFTVSEIERPTIDAVSIVRLDNPERKTAKDWLKLDELFRPTPESAAGYSYQESVIGKQQYPSVKAISLAPYQVTFFVQRDVHMYQISFDSRQAAEKNTNENAFYELISSFDFVPFTDATIGTVTSSTVTPSVSTPTLPGLVPVTTPVASTSMYADNTFLTEYEKSLSTKSDAFGEGITKYEFVIKDENSAPFGVYVTFNTIPAFNAGAESRRAYLEYSDSKNPESFVEKATFTLGPVGNWVLASGVDSGKGFGKVVVNPTTSTVSVLAAGMQLIESRLFKARFQVPAKWYWSITPDGYAFDAKPLQAGKEPMLVLSNETSVTSGRSLTTPTGKAATLSQAGEKQALCMATPKKTYCLLYTDVALDQTVLLGILDSIVEN